jgi:hypothetical protein
LSDSTSASTVVFSNGSFIKPTNKGLLIRPMF